jgi:hypothetical protein
MNTGDAFEGPRFVLPAGSKVALVRGIEGGTVDGYAVGDETQLAELTGNPHDAAHRWTRVPANAVKCRDANGNGQQLEGIIAAEAAKARHAAERAGHVWQAFTVTLRSGAIYYWQGYGPYGERTEALAIKAAEALEGGRMLEGVGPWSIGAYPMASTDVALISQGPGIWPVAHPITGKAVQS